MPDHPSAPIIFLAFANDRDGTVGYLRNLPEEARSLRSVLSKAQYADLCEVVLEQDATLDEILDIFQHAKYRNRIALFHYAGHANGYQLLLESAKGRPVAAHAGGLAAFLGQQQGLELVFLNGCSTEPQVQGLLNAGVSAVIATSQAIDDAVAAEFADRFYTALAGGAAIGTAFAEADAALKTAHGDQPGHFYRHLHSVEGLAAVADRSPWTLSLRRGAEHVAQWNLPDAAGDPLFGLPPLPKLNLPDSPYRYLDWYRREDAELFFGRGRDIRDLYTCVCAADAAPIVLFYGQSGVGKSSLLAAGLLPRLEPSHTVVYLRRDQAKGLLGTLTAAPSPLSSAEPGLGWLGVEQRTRKPLLVILDQMEELYSHPNPDIPQEMEQFLGALQQVFANPTRRPQGKLILSFRKEWLAEVDKQFAAAKLWRKHFFLERLDRQGIIEIVTGPARVARLHQHYGLTVEEGLAELIADDLLADPGAAVAPTLQILLTRLWARAKAQSFEHPTFSRVLYGQLRKEGLLLGDFLDQQLAVLRQREAAAVESGLALDLLAFHTTPLGTAAEHSLAEIYTAYRHQPDTIGSLVRQCQALYLLTDPAPNEPDREPTSRLAHDTLAPLVRHRFESSDAPGQRARRILENRTVEWQEGKTGTPLDEADLALVEAGASGMRAWNAAEQALVERSRTARDRRRQQMWFMRGVLAAMGLAIAAALILVFVTWSGNLAKNSDLAMSKARQQAGEALQLLVEDPVASIRKSLDALPEPEGAHDRAYVPEAEFALNQAIRSSLERDYLQVIDPPLTVEHVAFSSRQIAVGANGLYLAPYDLSKTGVVTLTDNLPSIKGVAWNDAMDAILVWLSDTVQVWLPDGQSFEPRFPQDGLIRCAHWRPHAKQIAICQGTSLWLWSYEEAEPQRLLSDIAEDVTIRDMAWSEDGQQFAAVGDTTAWFGSIGTPGDIRPINLDITAEAVEFLDGERLVIWNYRRGNHAQLWATSGERIYAFSTSWSALRDVALSPDKKKLLTLLVGGVIRVWDVETGELLRELHGHTNTVLSVAWHPQYPDRPFIASFASDGTARVWNLSTGEELIILRGHRQGHSDARIDVGGQWHHDGRHLFTAGEDGTIRLWRIFDDQGQPMCEGVEQCHGFSHVFSLSDERIETAQWAKTNTILVTDEAGDIAMGPPNPPSPMTTATILVTDEAGDAWRWRLTDLEGSGSGESAVLDHPPDTRAKVAWAPDGDWVFTCLRNQSTPEACDGDGTLRELNTRRTITVSAPISYATWLDMGLLVSQESGNLRIFNLDSGSSVASATLVGHKGPIHAAHAHGNRLATGGQDGEIIIWDYTTSTRQVTLRLPEEGIGGQQPITRLQWSPDGHYLLSSHGGDIVTLWDVEEQSHLKPWPGARAAAFSPDGRYVAVTVQRSFFIFDIQRGVPSDDVLGHDNLIQGIAWVKGKTWPNPDWGGPMVGGLLRFLHNKPWQAPSIRLLLLTWGDDRTVRLWDGVETSTVEIPRLPNANVNRMPNEPDTIAAAITEIARLRSAGEIRTAALNGDGSLLLTVDTTGVLRVWRVWLNTPEVLRETASNLVTHSPLDE